MRQHPKPGQAVAAALAVAIAAVGLSACGAISTKEAAANPEPKSTGVSMDATTCTQLAEEAVRISKGEDNELLKVRAPKIVTDNRKTFKKPKGDKEVLVLSCMGSGVWSDGGATAPVLLKLVVDADGDPFVGYEPQ